MHSGQPICATLILKDLPSLVSPAWAPSQAPSLAFPASPTSAASPRAPWCRLLPVQDTRTMLQHANLKCISQTLLEPQAHDAQHWHRCLQATGVANEESRRQAVEQFKIYCQWDDSPRAWIPKLGRVCLFWSAWARSASVVSSKGPALSACSHEELAPSSPVQSHQPYLQQGGHVIHGLSICQRPHPHYLHHSWRWLCSALSNV